MISWKLQKVFLYCLIKLNVNLFRKGLHLILMQNAKMRKRLFAFLHLGLAGNSRLNL